MDGDHGIYAASWHEAAAYGDEIYMVVPFLFGGNDPLIALATHGWRSSAATVIAGPWSATDEVGMRQAAEYILASYRQGYRQVDGILCWAATLTDARDECTIQIVLPILERALQDDDRDVRHKAVRAAARIGSPALNILRRALQNDDRNVQVHAVRAAGDVGAAALPILEWAVQRDLSLLPEAVYAAGKIGAPALRILQLAMESNIPALRAQAVIVASKIGAPAMRILQLALQDEHPAIREAGERAINGERLECISLRPPTM
jgi:HEAT repeat protein